MSPLRRRATFGSSLVFLLGFVTGTVSAGEWTTDLTAARKLSAETGRPILVHFHASWCGPCRTMDRKVLGTSDVKRRLGDAFIGVKIDADKHAGLVQRWNVRALPSDLVVDAEGRVLARLQGAQPVWKYLAWLDENGRPESDAVIAESNAGTPATTVSDSTPRIRPREVTVPVAKSTGLGLAGYSPIALWRSRSWVKGSREHAVEHEGLTYLFPTAEERAVFEADPKRYAPRLLGCDPVLLNESDRAVAGHPRYGAYFDEKLYLFATAETRARFRERPYRFTRTEHVLRAEQIGTRLR